MGEVFTMTSLLIWVRTRISERYLGDRGGRTLGLYYFLNHMSSGFLYLLHANFYPRFFCLSKRFIVDIYSPFCSDNIINFSLTLSPFGWSRHNIPSINNLLPPDIRIDQLESPISRVKGIWLRSGQLAWPHSKVFIETPEQGPPSFSGDVIKLQKVGIRIASGNHLVKTRGECV